MNIDRTQIQEKLAVHSKDGLHVGTVDRVESEQYVKLKRKDSIDGKHHFLPIDLVEKIDHDGIYLSVSMAEVRDQLMDEDDLDGEGMDIHQRKGSDRMAS